jgi:ATP phosphoribosyltransferase regulatory subunit
MPALTTSTLDLSLPAGMRDMLPARARARRTLARAVIDRFEHYGYESVVLPAFEREETIALGLHQRARKEMVRFLDPDSGEVMVLRPDMTPQIARVVATHFRDAPMPVRLAYEGSVVRSPAGRSRRHRQIAQAGIECVGWSSIEADAEVIAAVCDALAECGFRDVLSIEIAHAGITQIALNRCPDDVRDLVAEALSRRDCAVWQRLLQQHPVALNDINTLNTLAGDATLLDHATAVLDSDYKPALDEVRALRDALIARELKQKIMVDLGELRGWGYYTGSLFQILAHGVGEAIASGGRYDSLLARYGVSLPATGCAIHLETLEEALALRGEPHSRRDFSQHAVVAGHTPACRKLATSLRTSGWYITELHCENIEIAKAYAKTLGVGRVYFFDSESDSVHDIFLT